MTAPLSLSVKRFTAEMELRASGSLGELLDIDIHRPADDAPLGVAGIVDGRRNHRRTADLLQHEVIEFGIPRAVG